MAVLLYQGVLTMTTTSPEALARDMIRVHQWPGGWCIDVYPPAGEPFVGAGPYDVEGYAVEEADKWRRALAVALADPTVRALMEEGRG